MIEHELNTKTVEQIKSLVSFIETASDHPHWPDNFAIYCDLGKHPRRKDGIQNRLMNATGNIRNCSRIYQ